jgi:hypothetical protein
VRALAADAASAGLVVVRHGLEMRLVGLDLRWRWLGMDWRRWWLVLGGGGGGYGCFKVAAPANIEPCREIRHCHLCFRQQTPSRLFKNATGAMSL